MGKGSIYAKNLTRMDFNRMFADNVEKERYRLGLSQQEMADALDMSLSAYKRVINLTTDKLDLYMTYKLYQLTGKTASYYMDISDPWIDVQRKMLNLSESQLSFVESVVEFETLFSDTHEDAEDYITVFIPTGNMEDGMIYDSSNIEKLNVSSYMNKYGTQISCGIKVTSNHLHPVYVLGDILLISKRPIRDGDTGVFINRDTGCAFLRKFHQTTPCMLEPINGYGETFYVDSKNKEEMDRWIKFGVVIAKMR